MSDETEERTAIDSGDLIALINRRVKRAIDRRENNVANELRYILGRCTAHAEHIRPIQQRGD